MLRRKGGAGAVNQLVRGPLPWFGPPAGAWELGHVWLHIKPFHYILDPGKALCDLASANIYHVFTWLHTLTRTHTHTCMPEHMSPNTTHPHTHSLLPRCSASPPEPRTVADKAIVNLSLKVGPVPPTTPTTTKIKVRRIQDEILKCQTETWRG